MSKALIFQSLFWRFRNMYTSKRKPIAPNKFNYQKPVKQAANNSRQQASLKNHDKKRWELLSICQNAGQQDFFLLQCCAHHDDHGSLDKMTNLSISLDDTRKTRTTSTIFLQNVVLDVITQPVGLVWSGVGGLRRKVAHALSFVSRGFTKSWIGQVALRSPINRHAVDPLWFTGRSRPLGTRFSVGSMVLSLWSAPSSLEIPALRVPRYRLAPVDHLLVPLSPAKLPVSYLFFPILALHRFWPYRLLPPAALV